MEYVSTRLEILRSIAHPAFLSLPLALLLPLFLSAFLGFVGVGSFCAFGA